MRSFARPRALFVAAIVLAAVGCSPSDTTSTVPDPNSTSSPGESESTTTHPPVTVAPFEAVDIEVSADGSYLTDADGRAIYLFTLDDERTSTCEAACAGAWPPIVGDPMAGEGVDADLLGNAERGDGSIQVTYDGHPLYRYAADSGPGETSGHGFNGVWFLVGPDGSCLDC